MNKNSTYSKFEIPKDMRSIFDSFVITSITRVTKYVVTGKAKINDLTVFTEILRNRISFS